MPSQEKQTNLPTARMNEKEKARTKRRGETTNKAKQEHTSSHMILDNTQAHVFVFTAVLHVTVQVNLTLTLT